MTPKLTCMTYGGSNFFITSHGFGKGFKPRVTEAAMPQGGVGMSARRAVENVWRSIHEKRVQWTRAIAPSDHFPRLHILQRTTSRVKFNRAIVVSR